jgi:type I site-specific restriction endonuclease
MSKKDLSEADICDRYITPALYEAGWKKSQIRREYGFTDGQMIVRGQMAGRGARNGQITCCITHRISRSQSLKPKTTTIV